MIVTRGDVDLDPILRSLPFDDVVIWNNSLRRDLSCYGRFAGVEECRNELIYVQDDDIVVPVEKLLAEWDDPEGILANKKPDEEWRFLGVGALFPHHFVDCFDRYTERFGFDNDFCRVSDVVFAYQHPYRSVWVGYEELPWSRAPNRMYHQPDHYVVRQRAIDRLKKIDALRA